MLYRDRPEEDGIEDMTQLEYKRLKLFYLFMLNNLLVHVYYKTFLQRQFYIVYMNKTLSSRELHEAAVLLNLKKRFERELIYVSICLTLSQEFQPLFPFNKHILLF